MYAAPWVYKKTVGTSISLIQYPMDPPTQKTNKKTSSSRSKVRPQKKNVEIIKFSQISHLITHCRFSPKTDIEPNSLQTPHLLPSARLWCAATTGQLSTTTHTWGGVFMADSVCAKEITHAVQSRAQISLVFLDFDPYLTMAI